MVRSGPGEIDRAPAGVHAHRAVAQLAIGVFITDVGDQVRVKVQSQTDGTHIVTVSHIDRDGKGLVGASGHRARRCDNGRDGWNVRLNRQGACL